MAQWGRAFGTAAEYVVVPSAQAVTLADNVSFEIGASLGVPAMTAHRCLFADGDLRGKRVLVQGGAGAVGNAAILLAKWAGAWVAATVSREEQGVVAKAAGADLVINRHEADVPQAIRSATGGLVSIVSWMWISPPISKWQSPASPATAWSQPIRQNHRKPSWPSLFSRRCLEASHSVSSTSTPCRKRRCVRQQRRFLPAPRRGYTFRRSRKHMPSTQWPMPTSFRRAARLSARFWSTWEARDARSSRSARHAYHHAMTAFGSRNASRPNTPYSRPIPDCLKPPKGASGSCGAPFMTTRPLSSRSASACMCAESVPCR